MAQKYKVLAGIHIQNGVEYRKGATFVSERTLSKSFPGKFAVVGPEVAPDELEDASAKKIARKAKTFKESFDEKEQ